MRRVSIELRTNQGDLRLEQTRQVGGAGYFYDTVAEASDGWELRDAAGGALEASEQLEKVLIAGVRHLLGRFPLLEELPDEVPSTVITIEGDE